MKHISEVSQQAGWQKPPIHTVLAFSIFPSRTQLPVSWPLVTVWEKWEAYLRHSWPVGSQPIQPTPGNPDSWSCEQSAQSWWPVITAKLVWELRPQALLPAWLGAGGWASVGEWESRSQRDAPLDSDEPQRAQRTEGTHPRAQDWSRS